MSRDSRKSVPMRFRLRRHVGKRLWYYVGRESVDLITNNAQIVTLSRKRLYRMLEEMAACRAVRGTEGK